MKARCRSSNLGALKKELNLEEYRASVPDFEYEFDVEPGTDYPVLGIVQYEQTAWLYIVDKSDNELDFVPAVLFMPHDIILPEGMCVRLTHSPASSMEVIPVVLAEIPAWFERYVDEEEHVVSVVESEIRRMLRLSGD